MRWMLCMRCRNPLITATFDVYTITYKPLWNELQHVCPYCGYGELVDHDHWYSYESEKNPPKRIGTIR